MALFVLRKLKELEEVFPRVQRMRNAIRDSAGKFQQSDMVQLRTVEENLSDWAGLVARLTALKDELQTFSQASLIFAAVVAWKSVRVLGRLIDVSLEEMLKRQSWASSSLLLVSSISGWISLYSYRGTIVDHLDASTQLGRRRSETVDGGLEEGAEWYMQLLKNLKHLPNIFWFSTAASCLVGLQMSERVGVQTIRSSARSTFGAVAIRIISFLSVLLAYQAHSLSEAERQGLRQKTRRLLAEVRRRANSGSSMSSFSFSRLRSGSAGSVAAASSDSGHAAQLEPGSSTYPDRGRLLSTSSENRSVLEGEAGRAERFYSAEDPLREPQ